MKLHEGYEKRPGSIYFLDCEDTPLTEAEATYYLKEAWRKIYGEYPSLDSLALLWAQSAGETGRWKSLRNYNWGNIKRLKDGYWTSYVAGEVIRGRHQMFYPYHPETYFAAWKTALEGAEGYIRFLSTRQRYRLAWEEIRKGDPVAYCTELKLAGYFTADLGHYTRGVVSLVKEFKNRSEELVTYRPPIKDIEVEVKIERFEKVKSLEAEQEEESKEKEQVALTLKPSIRTHIFNFIINFIKKIASLMKLK